MTTIESRPPSPEDLADNAQQPCGHGRMMRKEDPRFIRGRGTYVDDVALPGMLHLAILRSPYAHARIVRIDVTAAQAHPKVKAVVTGADLAAKGLAWMPTLANDVQAVLATDKTRFQGQEVAFVVAEDRYSARDACELVDVDYEPRDPVVDARTALDPSAPVIRTDLEGKSDNHIFDWETGDAAAPLMPGAQLIGHEGDEYLGKVKVKVGPVTSEFSGKVHFVEQDRNQHRAVFDAKGKEARGTGNAAATVAAQLHEVGERTRVTVDTDLKIVGKLAQFGSGMLQQVSEKLLGQFVDSLEAELAAQSSESPQGTPPATEAAPIDLLQLADGGQLKKYGSALLAALTVLLLIWVLRRRR